MTLSQFNQQMQAILDKFALDQKQGGCSLCVYHQGQLVTSLGAGYALDNVPFTPNTLSLNFSAGKGILVTLIHVLVSKKLLDYDTPIAQYWQGFGQNGKENITLRQILSHEAGLYDIVSVTDHAKDMLDWSRMVNKIELMPISQSKLDSVQNNAAVNSPFVAYSALVSGWVLGGLVEKVTGLDLQSALEKHLLEPLGLVGQAYIGIPAEKISQVAKPFRDKDEQVKPMLVEDSQATLDFYQSLPNYAAWQAKFNQADLPQQISASNNPYEKLTTSQINSLYFQPANVDINDYKSALVPIGSRQFNYYYPASLQAKIPAANAVASSFALATIYAMLANQGEWQGKVIIDKATFEQLSSIQNREQDKIMPAIMQWRLGYHRVFALQNNENAFGHIGYNGAVGWCDPSRRLAVGFTHNYDVTMLNEIRQFIVNEQILDFFE